MNSRLPISAFHSARASSTPFPVEPKIKDVFVEGFDIPNFVKAFAAAGTEPALWLADNGVSGEISDDVAELLQSMALTCATGHDLNMPGSDRFWRVMKRMALDRFDYLNND